MLEWEIIIFEGCRFGFYGINCDWFCFINCIDNECYIVKGICFECKYGWIGILCNKGFIVICFWLINNCFVDVR